MTAKNHAADFVPEGAAAVGTVFQQKDFTPVVPEVGTFRGVKVEPVDGKKPAKSSAKRTAHKTEPAQSATQKEN